MVSEILGVVSLLAIWMLAAILLFSEYLDWFGRIEVLEEKHPFLHRLVIGRPSRLVLLLLVFALLAENTKEVLKQIEGEQNPPALKLAAIPAPEVCKTTPVFTEPQTSLRRRTIKLVNDLNLFWSERPWPQEQPVQNPASDQDRARNAKWDRYWQKAKAEYTAKDFNERILGIVREYKTQGVPTLFLEQGAEQPDRLIGAAPFGGFSLENCDRQYAGNELCQIRELAFHVNAQDKRIDPPDF